jgi:hypothetical protein
MSSLTSLTDFKKPDGNVDWKAYDAAQVANGAGGTAAFAASAKNSTRIVARFYMTRSSGARIAGTLGMYTRAITMHS